MSLDEITQCLEATLSSNPTTRISAELKLSDLLTTPDTGLKLAQVLLIQDLNTGLRQITCITLRRYVNERWSPALPQWKGPGATAEVKVQIRQAVFHGLSDPENKIRSLCAQIVSKVANSDWPDDWPDLLDSVIALLSSNSPPSVHGAMQVLLEIIRTDLTEDQILPVLRQLMPLLLNILGAAEQHSLLTRARAVGVFRSCVETLYMVKSQYPAAVKEAVESILPPWLDAFKIILSTDPRQDVQNSSNWDGIALRFQIYKALDAVQAPFHRVLIPYNGDLLTASLNHLNALYSTFVHYYLLAEDSIPAPSESESTGLPQLFCAIVDFLSGITRHARGKEWFVSENTKGLLAAVINWIQVTQDDEEEWLSNANAFVAQEAEDTLAFSVRLAGLDMLASLVEGYRPVAMIAMHQVIQEITTQSDGARSAGNTNWWRPLEAMLAAIGSQADEILEYIDDEVDMGNPKPTDVETLLVNVIPNLLGLSDCPFLQGRAFVFASQYTKVLPEQLAGQYLHATVQVLEAGEANIPIKVSAVKAIHNFCQGIDDALLVPVIPRIAKAVGPFLTVTSEDTLSLVLESLSVIVEIDGGKWMTPDLANSLVVACLDVWMKNNKDPLIISVLTEILASVTASPAQGVYETAIKQALPPLCNAIMASTEAEHWITGAAIDLACSLVRGAPDTGLGEGFLGMLAPSLFFAMKTVEDREVIQVNFTQLRTWSDPTTGQSGLDSVLAVIAKQMQSQDESGGLVIGDLIIHLLRRAGEAVLPILPELLQAMINRMKSAKTATFIQSLVIPFAFLINNQRDTVLSLLESMNGEGRSGLDILIQTWCENEETFQGFWAQRVSTLALCSLYASERPSLQSITVKGDLIIKPETRNVIMTRSKTKSMPTEFTIVPFPVKALKLLLHDLQADGEAASKGLGKVASDVGSDDGDSEWAEDPDEINGGLRPNEMAFLSDMLGAPSGLPFDNDDMLDAPDDEDLKNDQVSQMDMREHLLSFFRQCAARNTNNFSAAVSQLNVDETLVVRRIVGQ
ncbi:hypothetical protein POSPLADRAFT_1063974 [Postia placenta MAD-698-R-SB12]|uniref:Importin N-terminal domain-containing protein n=1 Tax=Postia placenta MAD-698-R-SB12 TaxID=670580 RepID=A0A1X6NFS2_9APHY|nr:hypothetical protein POSPLADRAFT_1063974 [Postia placenta MAD-698-R-SB12]OSX67203.1 hypothetical protein POSPLADRAFT_1063974 [Postia placenta MAD-698-R-SB12]